MTRLVPFPLLTLALYVMWLLLTGFSPGHMVLGLGVALLVSRVMLALKTERPTIRFGAAMFKLMAIVVADIARSNVAVAKIVLFGSAARHSGFIHVPLDLRSPYALATLAIIITATPGTLWLQHDAQRRVVLIHVLDLVDEGEWIKLIKNRYERLLKEIFE